MNYSEYITISIIYLLGGIALTTLLYIMYIYITEDINYYKRNFKYGKIEGKVINKDKDFILNLVRQGPYPPFQYYLEIEKEVDGEKLTRQLYVNENEYEKFNLGDSIKKERFKHVEKIS